MLGLHDIPGTQDHRALDGILQLTHIAGPGVVGKDAHRLGGKSERTPSAGLPGKFLEKGLGQRKDVVATRAQGRDVDLDHRQPEVEILAEPS